MTIDIKATKKATAKWKAQWRAHKAAKRELNVYILRGAIGAISPTKLKALEACWRGNCKHIAAMMQESDRMFDCTPAASPTGWQYAGD